MQTKIKGLYQRDKTYWIDITIDGKRIRRSTGCNNLEDAIDFKNKFLLNQTKIDNIDNNQATFDYIAIKFIEEKTRTCREKTILLYKWVIKNLFNFFTQKKLIDINKTLLKEYENYRRINGISDAWIRKEFDILNNILNLAIEYDLIDVNPLNKYNYKKSLKDYEPRERFLTPQEIGTLLKNSNKYLQRVIIFLLETGLRINELINLLYTDIAVDKRTNIPYVIIKKEISKSKKERFIPLTKLAMEQINKQKIDFPTSAFIFTDSKGNHYKISPKKALWNALEKSNIEKTGFHIFRHTFASLKLQGLDIYGNKITPLRIEIISKLLGHSNTAITEKVYAKFSKDDLLLSLN